MRRFNSNKVAVIMDSRGPHGADVKDFSEQIEIFTLPSNCTRIYQPMDMRIVATWKKRYRYYILCQIMNDVESIQERKNKSTFVLAGMWGMNEGYAPYMLDVTLIVKYN